MFKKLGSLVVLCLIVIGTINFVSLNKPFFSSVGDVVSKKPAAEIPSGIIHEVFNHQWKFIQS